jgi:hypothetical protein
VALLDMIWLCRHVVNVEGKFVSWIVVVASSFCSEMEMDDGKDSNDEQSLFKRKVDRSRGKLKSWQGD